MRTYSNLIFTGIQGVFWRCFKTRANCNLHVEPLTWNFSHFTSLCSHKEDSKSIGIGAMCNKLSHFLRMFWTKSFCKIEFPLNGSTVWCEEVSVGQNGPVRVHCDPRCGQKALQTFKNCVFVKCTWFQVLSSRTKRKK